MVFKHDCCGKTFALRAISIYLLQELISSVLQKYLPRVNDGGRQLWLHPL